MANCSDTGIQTCRGNNKFYNQAESTSSKSVSLFVMCKPRKSPFVAIPDTVPSPTSVDVTLSFTALAYPVPSASGFVWTRQIGTSDSWATVTANGSKTIISTWGLQSNLTIKDVQQLDYGFYNIFSGNDVGQFNHTFNLIPAVSTNEDPVTPISKASAFIGGTLGTAGGVVFLVALIIVVIMYRKRKALSNKNIEISSHYYNVNHQQGDGGNSNIYEGLQQTGFDQQYETVSPASKNVREGEHRVYENIQL